VSVIGLRPLDRHDLAVALEEAALPRLRELLTQRGRGHCMRVTDIDDILATRLCARLRAEVPTAVVVILSNGRTALPEALTVSSTKLVELRNPLPDGTQRPPLLVFIPNDVRTAAEDSYSRATFEEISLGDIYETLRDQLIRQRQVDSAGALAIGLTVGDMALGRA
jgi:DNA phosphorothioation-dependent restriction protein DptH